MARLELRLAQHGMGMSDAEVVELQKTAGDRVEAGEEIVITRRGKAVARLVPPLLGFDRERAHAAARRIRTNRAGITLGGLRINDLIQEGRL